MGLEPSSSPSANGRPTTVLREVAAGREPPMLPGLCLGSWGLRLHVGTPNGSPIEGTFSKALNSPFGIGS